MALLRPLADMRQQMERLFNEMEVLHFPTLEDFRPFRDRVVRAALPAVNLSETKGNYLLKVEVPGVKPADLRVEVLEDVVLVSGENREEQTEEHTGIHRRESSYGNLYRRILLPGKIKTDAIVAELEHGVLSLTLPKLEDKKTVPVQVQVK